LKRFGSFPVRRASRSSRPPIVRPCRLIEPLTRTDQDENNCLNTIRTNRPVLLVNEEDVRPYFKTNWRGRQRLGYV
jgi:hypothetical protein